MTISRTLLVALISTTCLAAGCASFSNLIDVDDDGRSGPAASDCRSCHIQQFKEWKKTSHSQSFSNPVFSKAYADAGDEECLTCHAPVSIMYDAPLPRQYNQEAGIDCISCHFFEGKMHGPYSSSALFQPHPVAENKEFFSNVTPCIPCHGETADEYGEAAAVKAYPECLACHSSPVSRTASQGTGLFSNMLVSFEETVTSFSHEVSISGMAGNENLLCVNRGTADSGEITVTICNILPHNLPTGTFGEKTINLHVEFSLPGKQKQQVLLKIADEKSPLTPTSKKKIRIELPFSDPDATTVTIALERNGPAESSIPAVEIAAETFLPLDPERL